MLTEARELASAVISASQESTFSASRAREALQAARGVTAKRSNRLTEAGAPAGGLPLAPAAPAMGLPAAPSVLFSALGHGPAQPTPASLPENSKQHPSSEVAVDARTRRTGNTDFLLGCVACMADGPNNYLATETATAVVFSARSLRKELPGDDLSVIMAWVQMAEGSWEEQQRMALIMGLVVSLRKAHDAFFPTTIR